MAAKASKNKVRQALAKVGGSWDERHDCFDSPAGMVWKATDCHSMAAVSNDFYTAAMDYEGWIQGIQQGVRPCIIPDCDMCAEGNSN